MDNIKKLPSKIINKIAAGEVVERPASVLKELLENSVDAGANKITIRINRGGLDLIEVEDNGKGIAADQIELAFTEHATSKIVNEDDLDKILTFGFRGEALASISAAADIEVHSYKNNSEPIFARFSNTILLEKESKPRNIGTTISVKDLFRYLPARKKFLSSENTEYKHLYNVFVNTAITNPEIELILYKDNKKTKHLTQSTPEKRVEELLNIQIENLIPIFSDSKEIKLSGFIGHPSQAHDRSPKQYLFLNNRPIQEKVVYAAVKEGFGNNIPKDRKPSYIAFLDINPSLVDVNVHPRKSEVKFSDSQNLFRTVKQSVQAALEKHLKQEFRDRFTYDTSTLNNQLQKKTPTKTIFETKKYNDYKPPKVTDPQKFRTRGVSQGIEFTKNLLNQPRQTEFEIKTTEKLDFIYIGQAFNTFLIFTKNDQFIIIDQHAADERVNFEKINSKINTDSTIEKQPLLVPFTFELSGSESEILDKNIEELSRLGIDISSLGDNSYQLSTIPALMNNNDFNSLINTLIEDLNDSWKSSYKLNQVRDKLTSTIACHSSIRAGDKIEKSQALKLISDLFNSKVPYSCPHGRPIIWEMTKSELFHKFERP